MVSGRDRSEVMNSLKFSEILIIVLYLTILYPVSYSLWYLVKVICFIVYISTLIYKYSFKKEQHQNEELKK